MKDSLTRIHAVYLRRQGLSYAAISAKLSISKGTLSYWLRRITVTSLIRNEMHRKRLEQLAAARARAEHKRLSADR